MIRVNVCTIGGYLGAPPTTKQTDRGRFVTRLRIATTDVWFDGQGNKRERTDWHDVVIFGPSGPAVAKILRKGSAVVIVGKNRTDEFTDRENAKQWRRYIEAREVHVADRATDSGGGRTAQAPQGQDQRRPANDQHPEQPQTFQGEEGYGDDIPPF
jgi:single-strand DNA-binding protein